MRHPERIVEITPRLTNRPGQPALHIDSLGAVRIRVAALSS
jgi:hypothetical protein